MVDVDEVQQELGVCRKALEQQLEHAVRYLTFPVGKFEHFGHAGPYVAKEVGFAWAFTTVEEVCTPERPYRFPRLAADVHFS